MTSEAIDETAEPPEEVTSLTQFMSWVQRQQQSVTEKKQGAQEFFYRGHADESYQLQPSAYRKNADGKSFREVEYQLYQEMLRRNTETFAEDKTTFERLVRMQHYGLPTRLLDVTQSALVALYFASEGDAAKNVNGEVILFIHPRSKVLHPPAISEASMAGLDMLLNFENMGDIVMRKFRKYFEKDCLKATKYQSFDDYLLRFSKLILNEINKINEESDFMEIYYTVDLIEEAINHFYEHIEIIFAENSEPDPGSEVSQNEDTSIHQHIDYLREMEKIKANTSALQLERRLAEIRDNLISEFCKELNFKNYYEKTSLKHFLLNFCLYNFSFPPLNSERIRRQQGAFLLFPPIESKQYTIGNFTKSIKVKISAKNKQAIISELAHLGITQSYLFPEPENQAKEIARKYPER